MGSSLKHVWLRCCIDRLRRMAGWEDNQQVRQQSRQVGGERWASLKHVNVVKSLSVVVLGTWLTHLSCHQSYGRYCRGNGDGGASGISGRERDTTMEARPR